MPTLELLHWNDVHARFEGLARLAGRARQIRDAAPHPVLLLDGGDVEDTGVRLSAMTYGVAGWRLLGAAGVDAAVVGNGGLLRYGPTVLPRYAQALGSAPLVCDLEVDGATPTGAAPSTLLEVDGLRVGIIGSTDYYTQYDASGVRERGRVTAVRREADGLRARGAEVVVLLSHAGIHHDRGLSWALRGRVDVIVGGHTHDLLHKGDRDQGVPIAQAGWRAEHLGRVLLEVDADGARVVDMHVEPVPASAPGDPAVLAELAAWPPAPSPGRSCAPCSGAGSRRSSRPPRPAPSGAGRTASCTSSVPTSTAARCTSVAGRWRTTAATGSPPRTWSSPPTAPWSTRSRRT